jgi:hypothetical protein
VDERLEKARAPDVQPICPTESQGISAASWRETSPAWSNGGGLGVSVPSGLAGPLSGHLPRPHGRRLTENRRQDHPGSLSASWIMKAKDSHRRAGRNDMMRHGYAAILILAALACGKKGNSNDPLVFVGSFQVPVPEDWHNVTPTELTDKGQVALQTLQVGARLPRRRRREEVVQLAHRADRAQEVVGCRP